MRHEDTHSAWATEVLAAGWLPPAGAYRLELGSPRALACADRRPRRSESHDTSQKSGVWEATRVVGEGANHCTQGRVLSPSNKSGAWAATGQNRDLFLPRPF
jgi:hypothetical protein